MARTKYIRKSLTLPDGSRKWIYGKTKKEAEEKLLQAKLQINAGVDLKNHDTFVEFAQMWFNTFKRGEVTPPVEEQIKRNLNLHVIPILGRYHMNAITSMQCRSVFSAMTEAGLSKATEIKVYQIMKAIFLVAQENGVIYKSPMTSTVKPGGYVSQKKKSLTDTDIERLLLMVRGCDIEPFIHIALGTGLRKSELMGLMWDNIDMIRCELHVRQCLNWGNGNIPVVKETLKSDAAWRTVPFDDTVKRYLLRLWAQREGDYVFHYKGNLVTSSAFYSMWNDAGLKGFKGLTPHILRHTAITGWFAAGLDVKEVQYLAGHSNANTTLDIYADYLAECRYEDTRKKIQNKSKVIAFTGA